MVPSPLIPRLRPQQPQPHGRRPAHAHHPNQHRAPHRLAAISASQPAQKVLIGAAPILVLRDRADLKGAAASAALGQAIDLKIVAGKAAQRFAKDSGPLRARGCIGAHGRDRNRRGWVRTRREHAPTPAARDMARKARLAGSNCRYHHVSGKYPAAYAVEMAWREDSRRMRNGSLHGMMASAALARQRLGSLRNSRLRPALLAH
jgi:hypothetical protein